MSQELVTWDSILEVVQASGWKFPEGWDKYPERKKQYWLKERYGLKPPPGVENYTPVQLADWLTHQAKRRVRLQKMKALVEKRAAAEKNLQLPPIDSFEPDDDFDSNTPKYVLRCIYGPMQGLPLSRIVALNYDPKYLERHCKIRIYEDDPEYGKEFVDHRGEGTGVKNIPSDVVGSCADSWQRGKQWGPKMFLWQLFNTVSALKGDCVIYFPHNGVSVRVHPNDFKEWVDKSLENPIEALMEPLKLLEG
jgi:hypothetical protein